jgi:hypothetical protein
LQSSIDTNVSWSRQQQPRVEFVAHTLNSFIVLPPRVPQDEFAVQQNEHNRDNHDADWAMIPE